MWQVCDDRVHRWRARRRELGTLCDLAPAGAPVHALLADEVAEILVVAEEWGPIDRSHRKLAHRGSYVDRVWVAPSTLRRVLAAHGLVLPERAPAPKRPRTPWPHWLVWEPNRIRVWDVTRFGRARRCVLAIVDMVSRCWTATLVSTEETSTQVRVVFDQALVAQGLDELPADDRLDLDVDDPDRPILLAVSDNGPAMTSHDTRACMAMMAIAQHHGRPRTPTGQAWIESFFGHITHEWPHLCSITDPALPDTEPARIRIDYNEVRLHEAIGCVTPNDEHHQRGETIREARRRGLQRARTRRLEHNRRTAANKPENTA
ncbi:DDE-type integrase/transposase/recombinase [Candidatus Poriferisodalis sp.]|uniref:DDE-type integrase/transposase/recombinase n=1 Tax=Candidatus Poriferisodalis sp. TaxID=3101277 RepID=UPI003C6F434C